MTIASHYTDCLLF